MSKPPSLETQVRTLKSRSTKLLAENNRFRDEVVRLRNTNKLLSDELAKWQARFDLLLSERNK